MIELEDVYEDADLLMVLQRLSDKYNREKELEDDEVLAKVFFTTGW